jgi:hypothetical protein
MKYLRKIFESKEIPLITKDFALDFQDIFLEIEDYNNLITEKSYYDGNSEEWKKIDDFGDLDYNQHSISFYMTSPLKIGFMHSSVDKNVVIEMIDCCKRVFQLSDNTNIEHTITYRDIRRDASSYGSDIEIPIDKIDTLIDKYIISICITSWSNF